MDASSAWQTLSQLSVGNVAAWIIVIGTIITVAVAGLIKLYRLFAKINDLKERDEERKDKIIAHDDALKQIQETLDKINDKLDLQEQMSFNQMKHTIESACLAAIAKGEIHAETYKTLSDMYTLYSDPEYFNKNGYIKSLMKRMKDVKIIGEIEL